MVITAVDMSFHTKIHESQLHHVILVDFNQPAAVVVMIIISRIIRRLYEAVEGPEPSPTTARHGADGAIESLRGDGTVRVELDVHVVSVRRDDDGGADGAGTVAQRGQLGRRGVRSAVHGQPVISTVFGSFDFQLVDLKLHFRAEFGRHVPQADDVVSIFVGVVGRSEVVVGADEASAAAWKKGKNN